MAAPIFDAAFGAQLATLFRWRRDVRRFRSDAVPPALLDELIDLACLAPSVGLSEPWRFVTVDDPARRARVRANFLACNAAALAAQPQERAAQYARLKLAGLDEAPCHLAVFADPAPVPGSRPGARHHAGDDGLFRGDGGAHAVAGGAGGGARASAGSRSSTRRR